jgi:hypothetical protein
MLAIRKVITKVHEQVFIQENVAFHSCIALVYPETRVHIAQDR